MLEIKRGVTLLPARTEVLLTVTPDQLRVIAGEMETAALDPGSQAIGASTVVCVIGDGDVAVQFAWAQDWAAAYRDTYRSYGARL